MYRDMKYSWPSLVLYPTSHIECASAQDNLVGFFNLF